MKLHLLALMLFCACQSATQYEIKGTFNAPEGEYLITLPKDLLHADTLALGSLSKGVFHIKGDIQEPQHAILKIDKRTVHFILEPGTTTILTEDSAANRIAIKGGNLQKQRNKYEALKDSVVLVRDSLKSDYRKYQKENDLFAVMHIRALDQELSERFLEREEQLIAENDNLVGASILFEAAKKHLKNNVYTSKFQLLKSGALASSLGGILEELSHQDRVVKVGQDCPNFSMANEKGVMTNLSDIHAPVIVLDFWASWCGPCRKENPAMKGIYEKYHDKGLEIVAISLDSKADRWTKAIDTDQLPWIHLSDLKGWDNQAASLFGVHGIPHTVVIANGKVIAQKLFGNELDSLINQLLESK